MCKSLFVLAGLASLLFGSACAGSGQKHLDPIDDDRAFLVDYVELITESEDMMLIITLCDTYGAEIRGVNLEIGRFSATMTPTEAEAMEDDERVIDVAGSSTPTGA